MKRRGAALCWIPRGRGEEEGAGVPVLGMGVPVSAAARVCVSAVGETVASIVSLGVAGVSVGVSS
jgi:hypothetical protein